MRYVQRHRGFTLIELLLTTSIVGLLAFMSIPLYRSTLAKNDLDIATATEAQAFHRAQSLARAVDGDSPWGMRVDSGTIVVFRGVSYAQRDATYDETTTISPAITVAGLQEVVFAKLSGDPNVSGATTLTSVAGDTSTITINAKGTITY